MHKHFKSLIINVHKDSAQGLIWSNSNSKTKQEPLWKGLGKACDSIIWSSFVCEGTSWHLLEK